MFFPHAVDIPRLPGFLVTPSDAVEFLLGELFQDTWAARARDESPDTRIWRGGQKARLAKVMEWQQRLLSEALGSPWIALKVAKPSPQLFYQVP